jgi:comEA protein
MYFTKSQKKAILFLVIILSLVTAYHFIDQILYPHQPFDFSQFEEKFNARRDSIEKILETGESFQSPDTSDYPANSQNPQLQNPIININTADKNELTKLPRIGPTIAQRIIDYRNLNGKFASKEDIQKVKGIGEKTFDKLKDLITVN